jgi:uncharacterized membrane protein YecN with MAPEG domain
MLFTPLSILIMYVAGVILVFPILTIRNNVLTTYGHWLAITFVSLTWFLFVLAIIANFYSDKYIAIANYIRLKFPKEIRKKNESIS